MSLNKSINKLVQLTHTKLKEQLAQATSKFHTRNSIESSAALINKPHLTTFIQTYATLINGRRYKPTSAVEAELLYKQKL